MKRRGGGVARAVCAAACVAAWHAAGAAAAGGGGALRPLRSRVEALGHGYVSPDEWERLAGEIEAVRRAAEAAGDGDAAAEAAWLLARGWSLLRGDTGRALALLREARSRREGQRPEAMRRLFLLEAELLAEQGDESGLRLLVAEYRSGPWYRPEPFLYRGGQGRDVPLEVTRPRARGGGEDLALVAMRRFLAQAGAAAGRRFPAFSVRDVAGREWTVAGLAGHVVLVDCWVSGWTPWHERLPGLEGVYRRHREQGFLVLGICQNLSGTSLLDFAAGDTAPAWPQVPGSAARDLLRALGVYGDATNFLLDREGRIVGRDLHGVDLERAVAAALE